MGQVSQVVVHFKVPGGQRRAVVRRQGQEPLRVKAVLLEGFHQDFVITRRGESAPIEPVGTFGPPVGVTVEGGSATLSEGPDGVCYLVEGGRLECWESDE